MALLKPHYVFGATGKTQNPYTLKFQAFKFEERNYGNRQILPFLENEYNRLSKITADFGSTLNTALTINK